MDPGSADEKPCDKDNIELLIGGVLLKNMTKFCGNNKNQHLYLQIESIESSLLVRISMASRKDGNINPNYLWNIKITQIDCQSDSEEMRNLRGKGSYERNRRVGGGGGFEGFGRTNFEIPMKRTNPL